MIPRFLKEFTTEIEKYKFETIKILATPTKKGERLTYKQSKFLGYPYLPLNKVYPLNKFGKPMIMLAQINFAEIPHLENYPTKGIFQIFIDPMFWSYMGKQDFCFYFHENIHLKHHTDFPFLTGELYEESPINCEHKLKFSKQTEYGGIRDFRFDISFNGKSYYDFEKGLSPNNKKVFNKFFYANGHKIGGYAYFTQGDPREMDVLKSNDLLLLQIDTDKEIMFGDAGISNIFINDEDLKNKKFENAYFNWDCV